MSKKNQSFTIEEGVIDLLNEFASKECISKSYAVEKILERVLVVELGKEFVKKVSTLDTPYVKPEVKPMPERVVTEEDHLKDWEWRKQMVADGRMHNYMAEEFPRIPTNANPFIEKTEEPVTTEEESENPLGDAITAKLKQ